MKDHVTENLRRKQWLKFRGLILTGLFFVLPVCFMLSESTYFVMQAKGGYQSGVSFNAQPPSPRPTENQSLYERLFGTEPNLVTPNESWSTQVLKALVGFVLATVLAALLAFRPRKDISIFRRNPYIAQTQILLAVVGAAMMIVVADNAARVFGIFAAATLIRFRTNIRDPKEITVLLASLSIGLASGVGRWELATALALFVMLILWPLERFELRNVFRTMELEVTTFNLDKTDATLKKVFKKHRISTELRKIDPETEGDAPGSILYCLNLGPDTRTDKLSEEIFSSDARNIDSIQWKQKKSRSYIYR